MTPEMPGTDFDAEPEPRKLSEISRLSGVFFEPTKAFTDIAARPRWLVPMLLVILATVAFYVTYGQHDGWRSFVEEQMQSNARMQQQMSQLSPEQRERSMNLQLKIMPIMYYVGPVVGMPLAYLFGSLILLGVASGIMSAGVKFGQVFAIECYAGLTAVIAKILGIVVIFLKSPEQFNLMNPLAFNPAAFMDPKTTSKFLYTIASGCDLFIFWGMLLTAIGLKAAAGKRLSFGGALFAVALPWAFFLLLGATVAGAFS
jgi:Yip1 domain